MFHHRVYTCTNCLWWCQVFDHGTSRAADEAATERVLVVVSPRDLENVRYPFPKNIGRTAITIVIMFLLYFSFYNCIILLSLCFSFDYIIIYLVALQFSPITNLARIALSNTVHLLFIIIFVKLFIV